VTTVTAQNSLAFRRAVPVARDLLADQIAVVLAEGSFACVKVGAVGSAENAQFLGSVLGEIAVPVVVDPVLASSSGGNLIADAEVAALDALCSAATVVTPNAAEAMRLAGTGNACGLAAAQDAGKVLAARWDCTVVVTGVACASGTEAVDVLCVGGSVELLVHPLVPDIGDVRGTGCMFSACLAAGLGAGSCMLEAVIGAQREVADLLGAAAQLGRGRMQIDLGALRSRQSAT
jgi:hydroxymethylpyrimidine/phosphomethylpyrimidine kinase